MAQWSNYDDAANSVNWAVTSVNQSINTTNQTNLYQNTTTGVIVGNQVVGQFAVDNAEEQAADPAPPHSGWILRREGTGLRAGRVTQEVLVAMVGGFNTESNDPVYPNTRIEILTEPQNSNVAKNSAVTLTVVAETLPAGGTISYQWQDDGKTGVWANVTGSNFTTGNTATLNIANNTLATGNTFRSVLTSPNAEQVNTSNVLVSSF